MKHLLTNLFSFCLCLSIGGILLLALPSALGLGASAGAPAAPLRQSTDASLAPAQPPAARQPTATYGTHMFGFDGTERTYLAQAPQNAPAHAPRQALRPAVILLAGNAEDALTQLANWQATAQAQDLVLIAPLPRPALAGAAPRDNATYLRAVQAQASRLYDIDPERIYLFAQGAGAQYALELLAQPASPVRAMALLSGQAKPAQAGEARLPLRFYQAVDQSEAPLPQGAILAKHYAAAGFPTEVVHVPSALPLALNPALAADAWRFLAAH